jgi:hypothetical protein
MFDVYWVNCFLAAGLAFVVGYNRGARSMELKASRIISSLVHGDVKSRLNAMRANDTDNVSKPH